MGSSRISRSVARLERLVPRMEFAAGRARTACALALVRRISTEPEACERMDRLVDLGTLDGPEAEGLMSEVLERAGLGGQQ
jgi:hypothetical protein